MGSCVAGPSARLKHFTQDWLARADKAGGGMISLQRLPAFSQIVDVIEYRDQLTRPQAVARGAGWLANTKYKRAGRIAVTYQHILYEVSEKIATITLNRPDR